MSRGDQYFHSKKNFAFDNDLEMDFGNFGQQKRGKFPLTFKMNKFFL